MKKIFNNKKGMSLIEILVSIILISLVILFLMVLITDVNTDSNLSKSRLETDQMRSDIVKTVQDRLRFYDVAKKPDGTPKYLFKSLIRNGNTLTFTFEEAGNSYKLIIVNDSTSITVTDTFPATAYIRKWKLPLANATFENPILCIVPYPIPDESSIILRSRFIKIVIPVDLSATIYKDTRLNLDVEFTYYTNFIETKIPTITDMTLDELSFCFGS